MAEKRELFDIDEVFHIMEVCLFAGIFLSVLINSLPVLKSAQRYFAGQAYQGKTDPRPVTATTTLQHLDLINAFPFTPWSWAHFFNRGPNVVKIGINDLNSMFEILPYQHYTVDRIGAEERISYIYYITDFGFAQVDITGEY